jgi:acyl-CoA-binding protein
MTITEKFQQAVANSKTLTKKPNNETLLQLYALYKQSTEGDATGDSPTNLFDFVAKAKHNAWAELKGKPKEEAMENYVNLVTKLKT